MTPTLTGRIQTRLLVAVVVGVPVAALVGALLGGITVPTALLGLGVLTALGLGWECVYHLLQQRRWDGDWPSSFALGAGVVEALVTYPVVRLVGTDARFGPLLAVLAAVWIAQWLAMQGPVSVFLPHWRHQGSRVIAQRSPSRAPRPVRRAVVARPSLPTLRPTRQQLVVLGGVAAMAVAVLLLAPLVGSRDQAPDNRTMPTAMEHKAAPQQRSMVDVSRTWNTTHRVRPRSLAFGAAGVKVRLDQVRMTPAGTLGTPSAGRAAWFSQGAAPGQRGPAVIVGDASGVFARLDRAHRGDRFTTVRSDGSVIRFVVDAVASVDAAHFPSQRVYGASLKPLARLISYDTATGRNVIVFAHAVAVTVPVMRS
ncbi:hypothetical protein GCM10028801_05680 [Nocardioides maradonensis]